MSAATWTPEEEARLLPYAARRVGRWDMDHLRWLLPARHRIQIRRHRRALRRRLRRAQGLAGRAA